MDTILKRFSIKDRESLGIWQRRQRGLAFDSLENGFGRWVKVLYKIDFFKSR